MPLFRSLALRIDSILQHLLIGTSGYGVVSIVRSTDYLGRALKIEVSHGKQVEKWVNCWTNLLP